MVKIEQHIKNYIHYHDNSLIAKTCKHLLIRMRTERKVAYNITCTALCNKLGIKKTIVSDNNEREVFFPYIWGDSDNTISGKVRKIDYADIFHAVIPKATLLLDSEAFLFENYIVNEKFGIPIADSIQFDTYPIMKWNKERSSIAVPRKKMVIGEAFSLIGLAAYNYYHWTFDIMSRMAYINKVTKDKPIPIIVEEYVLNVKQNYELLNRINLNKCPIISIPIGTRVQLERFHYISPINYVTVFGKGIVYTDDLYYFKYSQSKEAIDLYRNIMLKHIEHNVPTRKIMIIRRGNCVQRLTNYEKIEELAVNHGFELYNPAEKSLEEQVIDFHNAKYVIADSGAALVNLLWCSYETKVACISDCKNSLFSTIAYLCNVPIVYLRAEMLEGQKHILDEDYFISYLTSCV